MTWRNWTVTGPIQQRGIGGRLAPYWYFEATHARIGHRYHARPIILPGQELAKARAALEAHEANADVWGDGDKPVTRWGVREIHGGMVQAFAVHPGAQESTIARAKTRADAVEKLRTRVASLGYYLTDTEG